MNRSLARLKRPSNRRAATAVLLGVVLAWHALPAGDSTGFEPAAAAPGPASDRGAQAKSERGLGAAAAGPPAGAVPVTEIGVAYGTEKRAWLEWATREFAAGEAGRRIRVNLIPMGSVESARAIVDGDQRLHVWSPASSLYRQVLIRDWSARYRGHPILKEEALALTPMVLVMWKERYEAFAARSPEVSLRTFYYAMHAKSGWGRIAGQPEWGVFKFGHTHPDQSNSGLMTLILLAYNAFHKKAGLTVSELNSPAFRDYLAAFERGVTGLSNSTGNLMKEMTTKGPSGFDALMVYENLAIDYFRSGDTKWGPLQVIYPAENLWNENPYCILNTPWTTQEHQDAAAAFLRFLLSEPIQRKALDYGFRPGNAAVPVKGPESPFARFAEYGLKVEVPEMCEVPSAEAVETLQQLWLQHAVPR